MPCINLRNSVTINIIHLTPRCPLIHMEIASDGKTHNHGAKKFVLVENSYCKCSTSHPVPDIGVMFKSNSKG